MERRPSIENPNMPSDDRSQRPGFAPGPDQARSLPHEFAAVVQSVRQPLPTIRRVEVRMADPVEAEDPAWTRPNVGFRVLTGPEYGDASRIYTVRNFEASSGTIEFDVVIHGANSPGMRWSSRVGAGDGVELKGPFALKGLPEADGKKVALFLDATAIPALYSIMQRWPKGLEGVGWIVTEDAQAFAELPKIPGLTLRHVSAPANLAGSLLFMKAQELADPTDCVVWGAGEREEMRSIRNYFRTTIGMTKEHVDISGYWALGISGTEFDRIREEALERYQAEGKMASFDPFAL